VPTMERLCLRRGKKYVLSVNIQGRERTKQRGAVATPPEEMKPKKQLVGGKGRGS